LAQRIPAPRTVHLKLVTDLSDATIQRIIREATQGANTTPVTLVKERKPVPTTWRTKKQRARGEGFACTVPGADNCGRKDLRTPLNTGSHTLPEGHSPSKKR
jgi:hypothetical protein